MHKFLKMTDWQGKGGALATSDAIIGYRLSGKTARHKLKSRNWTAPVYLYLNSELTEKQLLSLCTNDEMKTRSHLFCGLSALFKGDNPRAENHFLWVKKNGDRRLDEYTIASAELNRLRRRLELQKPGKKQH